MGGKWLYSWCFCDTATRIYSKQNVASLSRLLFSKFFVRVKVQGVTVAKVLVC